MCWKYSIRIVIVFVVVIESEVMDGFGDVVDAQRAKRSNTRVEVICYAEGSREE